MQIAARQRVEWLRYVLSWVAELTDVKVRLAEATHAPSCPSSRLPGFQPGVGHRRAGLLPLSWVQPWVGLWLAGARPLPLPGACGGLLLPTGCTRGCHGQPPAPRAGVGAAAGAAGGE